MFSFEMFITGWLPQFMKELRMDVPLEEDAMLTRLPDLPWPRNLFAEHTGILKARASQQHLFLKDYEKCICGKPHHQLYPRTKRSEYGNGFKVTYYCSDACKGNAAHAESGQMYGA